MGQEEKKAIYSTCKDLGLEVKWIMSESKLRAILDEYTAEQERIETEAKAKKAKEDKEAKEAKAKEAKAKKAKEAKAKKVIKEEPEPELEEDPEPEKVEEEPEEVDIQFIEDDDIDVVQHVTKPNKVIKSKKREQVLKARYFPKNIKKKSVSESPLEIYKKQMSRAGQQSRNNRRKYKRKSIE